MEVIKKKTGCYCHNCDHNESEYIISNDGSFIVFWATGEQDCEIAFCESCAKELFEKLGNALSAK